MDAPVTPVTSGKPRSRIRVQNFVAVEGLMYPPLRYHKQYKKYSMFRHLPLRAGASDRGVRYLVPPESATVRGRKLRRWIVRIEEVYICTCLFARSSS